jgi:hypothetical protein
MGLLDGLVPLGQGAKECGKSERTLQRWAQQRKIPITYVGKTPYLNTESFRKALASWETKVPAGRRGSK